MLVILLSGCYFVNAAQQRSLLASVTIDSDADFFGHLELSYPGLEPVKSALSNNDLTKARVAYLDFLRKRIQPVYRSPYEIPDSYPSTQRVAEDDYATQVLNNNFEQEGVYYRFTNTINWQYNPTDIEQNPDYRDEYKREWTVQLNRMYSVKYLAEAFHDTGNPIYSKKINYLLSSWLHQSP
ncbi:MAG: heparinase II/III family protein, partial [Bacteroidota bacterium]